MSENPWSSGSHPCAFHSFPPPVGFLIPGFYYTLVNALRWPNSRDA